MKSCLTLGKRLQSRTVQLSISDDAFTYFSWLFPWVQKHYDRKINELISGNLGGKLPEQITAITILFSAFLILVGIGSWSAKVLM